MNDDYIFRNKSESQWVTVDRRWAVMMGYLPLQKASSFEWVYWEELAPLVLSGVALCTDRHHQLSFVTFTKKKRSVNYEPTLFVQFNWFIRKGPITTEPTGHRLRHYEATTHQRATDDDLTSVTKLSCANPAFRSPSWTVADWTVSGHILRNSCHSEVSVTMARARTQNIHHLLLFCWTRSVGPRHFCCWCGRQLVTDWQQLVSMFQAIWEKTGCRMPAQAKITSVQSRESGHSPDSCHHTICSFQMRGRAKSLFSILHFSWC